MRLMISSWVRMAALVVLLALAACLAPAAMACSPGPAYLPLSNYDLVKKADDIVLARAVSTKPGEAFKRIGFTVLKSLKGRCRAKASESFGTTDPEFYRGAGSDDDFERARPGTYSGSCSAHDYKIGKTYLLFLQHFLVPPGYPLKDNWIVGERVWQVGVEGLSRDREEVSETGSAWMKTVEHYARIDRLKDPKKEKAALRELRAQAAADTLHRKFSVALVADLDRHFQTVSPYKSYEDLMAFYRSGDERKRSNAVQALAQKFEPRAFALLREQWKDEDVRSWLRYLRGVSHPQQLAEAAGLWEKWRVPPAGASAYNVEEMRREIADVLCLAASDADYAAMARAVRGADVKEHSGATIMRWFAHHVSPGALGAIKAIVGGDYKNSDLLGTLLTLGDEDAVRWAIANAQNNGLRLAALVAESPTRLADEAARKIIAAGDPADLEAMVWVYTNTYTAPNRNPHRWDRLRDIIALPDKSPKAIGALHSSFNPLVTKGSPDFARFEELRKLIEAQIAPVAALQK